MMPDNRATTGTTRPTRTRGRFFVTGVGGQLGHDVMNELVNRGHIAIGSDIAPSYAGVQDGSPVTTAPYVQLDITQHDEALAAIERVKPIDGIIHCAAWTNVDKAEDEDVRPLVYRINAEGTRNIAEAAKAMDAKLIYISTDYVFGGEGTQPWQPDDKDFKPLNYYAVTKLEGEKAVSSLLQKFFIVRIAWAFGLNGNNFIKTMINVGKKHDQVRVVNDQIGTPTYTLHLARLLADMIETEKYGFYHATNSEETAGGYISWYDYCCEIYRQYGLATRVIPVSSLEYGLSKAKRPANSRLDKSKLVECGFKPLPDWKQAVKHYLQEAKL